MNRTDRLLAIVLEIQGRGKVRAEDLADIFETSKRTIYRDIQALGQAGVPLVSTPGRGYALLGCITIYAKFCAGVYRGTLTFMAGAIL